MQCGADATPRASPQPDAPLDAWRAFCQHDLVRPHASKLAYAQEWKASLQESHPDGGPLDAALAAVDEDCAKIAERWPGIRPALSALREQHGA
jgi:hypothetical protein